MNPRTKKALTLLVVMTATLSLVLEAYAQSNAAPAKSTGGPGEGTCNDCHKDFLEDSGGGSLALSGVPATYTPGNTYAITVTLAQSGQQRWGFQATALLGDGSAAGTLTVTDATNTVKITGNVGGNTREYITQTSTGTYAGTADGPVSWTFDWTAPGPGSGTVNFYATGNAADNQGNTAGDYTYTTTAVSNEGTPATPPTVTLSHPSGGQSWSGGATKRIWWNMSDAEDANTDLLVWINYSTDGGASYPNAIGGAQGLAGVANPNFYDWSLPLIDSVAVRVQVTVVDTAGLSAADASPGDFELDSTGPIASGSPTGGGVSAATWVNVSFNEPMNQPAAEGAFELRRASDWALVATTFQGWVGDTMRFAPTAPLAEATPYQGNVSTAARDDSNPGNPLAAPYTFTFTTADATPPSISAVTAVPDPQEAGGLVNVSALITDAVGVAEVTIDLVDPNAVPLGPFPMAFDVGTGRYYYEAAYSVLGVYQFTLTARDAVPNEATQPGTFTIQDTTPPEIFHTPVAGGIVGMPVNVEAQVMDEESVSDVRLDYVDVLGGPFNVSMTLSGGLYRYTIPGQPSTGTVCYFVWAVDGSGNANLTTTYCFDILGSDGVPPSINSVSAAPDPQQAGLPVNITASITDNVAVAGAWIEVYDPTATLLGNFTMGYDIPTAAYYYAAPYADLGLHTFTLWASDTSGNWNTSGGSFLIQDTAPPAIAAATAIPDPQEVFLSVNVSAEVTDNMAVAEVWLNVTGPAGWVGNFSMAYDAGTARYYDQRAYGVPGAYAATLAAADVQGNWATAPVAFTMVDTTAPTFGVVTAAPDPQEVLLTVNVTAEIQDLVGVAGATLEVTLPDTSVLGPLPMAFDGAMTLYYREEAYALVGTHAYTVTATDGAGNSASTGGTFEMVDTTAPAVGLVSAVPDTQPAPGTVNVTAEASDNYGLAAAWVNVTRDGVPVGNFSMTFDPGLGLFYYESTYPLAGSYAAVIWVEDASGNGAAGSTSFTITAANTPPELLWLGDPGYENDALDPESGNSTVAFRFRIWYRDADNDNPLTDNPMVHILEDGVELPGSPFLMSFMSWKGGPGDFVTGVIYEYPTTLPFGDNYSYFITAFDERGGEAVPTPVRSGPLVRAINTPPTILLTSPHTGETYVQREKRLITWTMSDAETPTSQLTVYLNYTYSGGAGTIAGPIQGDTDFVWLVPPDLEANNLIIEATVMDPEGLTDTAVSPPIDVVPPSIPTRPFLVAYWAPLLFALLLLTFFFLWWLYDRKLERVAMAEGTEEGEEEASPGEESPEDPEDGAAPEPKS